MENDVELWQELEDDLADRRREIANGFIEIHEIAAELGSTVEHVLEMVTRWKREFEEQARSD